MKPRSILVLLLAAWIRFCRGQYGEFEGSAETSFGGVDRLVPFDGDTCITSFAGTTGIENSNLCPFINLPRVGITFNDQEYTRIYICDNGLIRLRDGTYQPWPRNFGLATTSNRIEEQDKDPVLAPYWAIVDAPAFRSGTSKLCYRKYEDKNSDDRRAFERAQTYGRKILSGNDFSPVWVMIITWQNVKPLNPGTFGGKNTFQVLLASDDSSSICVYIYADIDWAVRAFKKDYGGYTNAIAPVVGWNAGRRNGQYRDGKEYKNFKNSGRLQIEEIDDERGNLDELGLFGIVLQDNTEPTPEAQCIAWYIDEVINNRRSFCPVQCPPFYPFMPLFFGFLPVPEQDPFPELESRRVCLINSFSPRWRPAATRCCYRRRGRFGRPRSLVRGRNRLAGGSLDFHPLYYPTEHAKEKKGFENCCIKTRFCRLYYRVRDRCWSRWRRRFWWGWGFGDPHFQTLDGKNYTFNGCGWYTYFQGHIPNVGNSSMLVQVRTTKVGDANATGFTGIVLKEGISETIQVNLKSNGGLLILVDGTEQSASDNATTFPGGLTLSVVGNGTINVGTPLGNSLQITEAANGTFLTIVLSIIDDYKNSSKGLLGYWNDNIDDDFTLPNGTVLSINLTDSQIHYDFGEQWNVTNASALYVGVQDDEYFKCPAEYTPIFLDQALQFENSTLKEEAEKICGNDVNCLFDIAATGNTAIGQSTLDQESTINNEFEQSVNNEPIFTENITELNVTLGKTFYLTLNGYDADGDALTFDVEGAPPGAVFVAIGNVFNFTWLVNSTDQVNLTFSVSDTKNATTSFTPDINLCACQNNGTCFIPEATSAETAGITNEFLIMDCECPLGKTGRYCESQKDFCQSDSGTVCHPLVSCTNKPTSFTCGPCPSGFSGDGRVCDDVDECAASNGGCDHLCTNADGTFQCSCNSGYTLDSDQRTCKDVNECSLPNDCAQLCNNTAGSYECYCRIGFKIKEDDVKNCKASDVCSPEQTVLCDQICYMDPLNPGQHKCSCNAGYVLMADGSKCQDVDECASTETNLCDQVCSNTNGSYICSCRSGFEPNGQYYCKDINECLTGDFTCDGSGETCENIIGGYRCKCFENLNLIRFNGTCVYKDDPNAQADPPPEPPSPTIAQQENAIQLRIRNFQSVNWTETVDTDFRTSVVKLVNEYCNAVRLRAQDCGATQNQLFFNLFHVQRIPGYPNNTGSDVQLQFYMNYPDTSVITSGTTVVPKSILASIIFAQLATLEQETNFTLVLETSVIPDPPVNPTADQTKNAVQMEILNFNPNQWTTFYDAVFSRAVAVTLNEYCNRDAVTLEECGLTAGTQASFNQSHIKRIPGSPSASGANTGVSFYVSYPDNSGPVRQIVLASIFTTQRRNLESSLDNQKLRIITSYAPSSPQSPTAQQITNNATVQISSFQANEWTYLHDQRFRKAIANRLTSFCNQSSSSLTDCQISSNQVSFTVSDVQRTTGSNPTQNGINTDLTFYVSYPGGSSPMTKNILASVLKDQLDAIQLESGLTLTLQTSFAPTPPASPPTNEQSTNLVEIELINFQADQWTAIQDNRLRASIATQILQFCNQTSFNLLICNVRSDQVSFSSAHVKRNSSSPTQNGNNATYSFFIDYPSGNGPVPKNLAAEILNSQLAVIKSSTGLQLLVQTSPLASPAPSANSTSITEAITVVASNTQANQWSAIQDNKFRVSVAQALNQYCNLNEARRQECGITGGQSTFNVSHVQRVPNSPSQNGSDSEITFYATYPSGREVPKNILALVMVSELALVQTNTGLQLTVRPIITPSPVPPPTAAQNESSIEVQLTNFPVSEWPVRDTSFKQNMAKYLIKFCNSSQYHLELCNISRNELFSINSSHVQTQPNSPSQKGSDAILTFYVNLPSGSGTVSKHILASAFTTYQEKIITVPTTPLTPATQAQKLTAQQQENLVPITIYDFKALKFTSIEEIDIKITVAERMNNVCFGAGISGNPCGQQSRRRKRAVTSENQFTKDDVLVDQNSIQSDGQNTLLNITVTYPGQNTPVSSEIVKDALQQSFEQDRTSKIRSLNLNIYNSPAVTAQQTSDAIEVRLTNFNADQWSLNDETSFRQNLSAAIVRYCKQSADHLKRCNMTSNDLTQLNYRDVQPLPNSPTQNGTDAVLTFFVNLPSGTGTLPKNILSEIFTLEKENILSQPSELIDTVSTGSSASSNDPNLVEMKIILATPSKIYSHQINDIRETIAERMNQYCADKLSTDPCNKGAFSAENVRIDDTSYSKTNVSSTYIIKFHVVYPGTDDSISRNVVNDILHESFKIVGKSNTFSIDLSVELEPTAEQTASAIEVRLLNFNANQWSINEETSLRQNLTAAIIQYCNQSTDHLRRCNMTRDDLAQLNYRDVKQLPNSPTQNGTDSVLSFFVNLPSGTRTLPKNILSEIFTLKKGNILSQPSQLIDTDSTGSSASSNDPNLVEMKINLATPSKIYSRHINDIRETIAERMNQYCANKLSIDPCNKGQFTTENVRVDHTSFPTSASVSNTSVKFLVVYPGESNSISANVVNEILYRSFKMNGMSKIFGIHLSVELRTSTPEQIASAVEVRLINFNVDQWPFQDASFRRNMSSYLIKFCDTSQFHLELCNIPRNELLSFNSSHIQRLPNSPSQTGSDATLAFYANLPSGSGTVPKNISASAFTTYQQQILALPASVNRTSVLTPTTQVQVLTLPQQQNLVPIRIHGFEALKFTLIQEIDIKITVAGRMNNFCFGAGISGNPCGLQSRRKKRAATSPTQPFKKDDVVVDQNSIQADGNNTLLNITVMHQNTPVSSEIVKDALDRSFEKDSTSNVTSLNLAIYNPPAVTEQQSSNAIEVNLTNFNADQWSLNDETSFRQNLSAAIVRYCNQSADHLQRCNMTSNDLTQLNYLDVQPLPNSPTQNGTDAVLSFFVNLPSGTGTLPKSILSEIYAMEKDNILSQPTAIIDTVSTGSGAPSNDPNLVELRISLNTPSQLYSHFLNDIRNTIAERMNEHCSGRSSVDPCNKGTFSAEDVRVDETSYSKQNVSITHTLKFHVVYPGTTDAISANVVREILHDSFNKNGTSKLFGIGLSVESGKTEDSGVDWPLILGSTIAGVLLLLLVISSIVIGVSRSLKASEFTDDHYDGSSREWEFDGVSPYAGSPFSGIDTISGFDEDGLPSERPGTRSYQVN